MWITALILGFAGSLHCVGMCSPLVMGVTQVKPHVILNKLLYNSGRIFTYATMGAVVSGLGMAIRLFEFQSLISLVLGVALIVAGMASVSTIRIPVVTLALQKFSNTLKRLFSKFIQQKTKLSMAVMGMLNGLLPCGLTYLALTYCLTLVGPLDGFNFMLLFGAGTLPAMLGFTSLLQVFVNRFNWNVNRLAKVMLVVMGCLLVMRVFISHSHDPALAALENHIIEVICK